jgi:hypothetical protein
MPVKISTEPEVQPAFIRPRGFARLLNISYSHGKVLIARRVVPTVRVGRAILIPIEAAKAYARDLTASATPAVAAHEMRSLSAPAPKPRLPRKRSPK